MIRLWDDNQNEIMILNFFFLVLPLIFSYELFIKKLFFNSDDHSLKSEPTKILKTH